MSCKMKEVAMDKVLYNAAVKGDKSFLTDAGDKHLLGKNQQNNHIVHIAVRHKRLEFIQEAVKRFPQLISEANGDGDNPLHLAAQTGNLNIMKVLVESYKAQTQAQSDETKPWRVQNEEGNTPLHVALINHHIKVALFLVEQDGPEVARICNNFLETPLHLAIKHRVDDDVKAVETTMKLLWKKVEKYLIDDIPCQLEKSSMRVIEMLLQKENLVACWRDEEGLTPLLGAAKLCPSYLPAIKSIVEHCPESVEVCDASGKTLLHLINKLPMCVDYKELLYSNPQVMALKNHQDKDGNTPTHIALDNQNMDLFLVLLKSGVSLTLTNNEGVSVTDLIKLKADQDFWKLYKNEQYEMIWSLLSDDKKTGPEPTPEEIKIAMQTKDIKFVRERIEKDGSSFLRKKYVHYNILHLLIKNKWQHVLESTELTNLVKTILDILPCLICERDYSGYGKTPLHGFVKSAPEMVNKPFLEMIKNYFERAKEEATTIEELCYDPPWKTKDHYGNTPLHKILDLPYEAKFIRCARQIMEFDPTLKSQVNIYGENPLHLLSKLHVSHDQIMKDGVWEDVDSMVKDLMDAREMRDVDGLTPFLRAAKEKNLVLLKLICAISGLVRREVDDNDNNCWHLLADMEVSNYRQAHTILFHEFPCPLFRHLLVSQNKNGDTPLHIAIQNNSFQIALIFIDILKEIQELDDVLNQCNHDGNTPFHLVAGKSNLPDAKNFIQYALDNYSSHNTHFGGILNKDRNTPLHLAISKGDLELAQFIIEHAMKSSSRLEDVHVVNIRNNEGNTALHLAVSKGNLELAQFIIDHAMKSSSRVEDVHVVNIRNNEGNTALHLAVSKGNLELAQFIIEHAMKSSSRVEDVHVVNIRNNEGNTALHLAVSKGNLELAQFIIDHAMKSSSRVEYVDVVSIPDNEGNTALHLATLKDHFNFAMSLIKGAIYNECLGEILEITNKQKKTPSDLIGSAQNVPDEFERFIWENSHVMFAMLGVRRLSGVPTGNITDHINTMGVIAGLLATITFTAAFTTPGGLNSDSGTPFLMKKIAFKVFMVLDILALCLSMLVLFSLLWIMNVGHKRIQVVVLDLAVLLLRGAFCTTILTFMMGVFVTIYPVSHWIAITTCVLCSLLLFLINSNITIRLIIPSFIRVYVLFSRIVYYIKESWRRPKYLTNNQSHQKESGNYGQANQQIARPPSSCEP